MKITTGMLAAALLLGTLAGCTGAQKEVDQVSTQETQLSEYRDQANAWGADIMEQVPASEAKNIYPNMGGTREAGVMYEEWPKYYFWEQGADLLPEGPRSPEQLADDLEPWLKDQGWVRNTDAEAPAGKTSFTRGYQRDDYSLAIEVFTVEPPRAQTLNFTIVTPSTTPAG